jgi:hypothetical protein
MDLNLGPSALLLIKFLPCRDEFAFHSNRFSPSFFRVLRSFSVASMLGFDLVFSVSPCLSGRCLFGLRLCRAAKTAIDQILLGPRRISLLSLRIRFSLSVSQCPLKFLCVLCIEVLTLTLFSLCLRVSVVGVSFGCGSAALWLRVIRKIIVFGRSNTDAQVRGSLWPKGSCG